MTRIRTSLTVLVVVSLALAGCSRSDLQFSADGDSSFDGTDVDASPDEVVELALDDVRAYWQDEMPNVYGMELTPLAGGLVPYGPSTEPPQCGPTPIQYEDVAENALYCPEEDLIAWDEVGLIPGLLADFGSLTVGVVMAHEFAHAVQQRGAVGGQTVMLELQADCYAGAWAADVSDRIELFSSGDGQLDHAIGGFLELRDTLGVAAGDPQAHGSGFDRVSAFQDGYEDGAELCATYEESPPTVVAIPFGSTDDVIREGNLPTDELLEFLVPDLESYYGALFDDLGETWDPVDGIVPVDPAAGSLDCGDERLDQDALDDESFYCAADDTIYFDATGLLDDLEEIGDFAFGGEVSHLYAVSAQQQLDVFDADEETDGLLHADCFTGAFAAANFLGLIPDQGLRFSPGDLDEVMIAFLTFGDADGPSAFERTAAFRAGFVDGVGACDSFD